MFGTLEYDADGNLIARLGLYRDATAQGPEIGRITVGEQIGLINEYGQDAAFEELSQDDQAAVISRMSAVLRDVITYGSFVTPYVNPYNDHPDLSTAVRRAVEPGGPLTDAITFRVVAN